MKQLLAELFDTYYKDIYTYLYSLCRDPSLSEDLTSEVFLEVVRSIATFRGESDIKTWLFTIARRRWFAYLKKQKSEPVLQPLHELYDCNMPSTEDTGETEAFIQSLVKNESEITRRIFDLRLMGYSYYEIGKELHISENSARVIFFRLKTKLKKLLEKEGFFYE